MTVRDLHGVERNLAVSGPPCEAAAKRLLLVELVRNGPVRPRAARSRGSLAVPIHRFCCF